MRVLILLIAILNSQHLYAQYEKEEKSNLFLIDSSKLIYDFLNYKEVHDFINIYSDTTYSFFSGPELIYYDGQVYIAKKIATNVFDSICRKFVYEIALTYKWKERRRSNIPRIYKIQFAIIYNHTRKSILFDIIDETKTVYATQIFRKEIKP